MSLAHVSFDIDQVESILDSLAVRLRDLPARYRDQIAPDVEQLAACLRSRATAQETCASKPKSRWFDSETKFHLLTDSMPQLVWTAFPDGTTDYLNLRAGEFDGFYQLADGTWTWQPVTHPDEQEATIAAWQHALETGEPYQVEHRARMADGTYRWYLTRGIPIKDEQGQVLHWYGTSTDIHDLKETELSLRASEAQLRASEARLRESETRFRTSVENLEDAFAILSAVREPGTADHPGRIIDLHFEYINQVGCRMKHRPFEELVGHSPLEFQDTFYTPQLINRSIRVIETGEPFTDEDVEYEEDGQGKQRLRQAFQLRGFKMGDGVVIIRQDITRQKRIELDLREREASLREIQRRFNVALAAVPISVYTIDRDLRYTWMYNPRHGYNIGDLLGKRDDELLPPDDAAELVALKQQVIDTGQGIQREIKMKFDGRTSYYILTLEPTFDYAGRVVGMTGAGLDITQQRLIEAEHQETVSEMELQRRLNEHREKERQQIARDIHDGPIQSMVSILFNLQADKEEIQDPKAVAMLQEIAEGLRRNVQELREVVNELRPPALLRYGLSRAIRIHCLDFREKYPEIRVELDLVNDADLLPEETCLVLYRIYQEAMNNIVRHAEASQVWVRYVFEAQNLVMEIKDNGKGFNVPADFVDLARQNHFGMAGMRERLEAVGGKFHVFSRPGQGTKVVVSVPVEQKL